MHPSTSARTTARNFRMLRHGVVNGVVNSLDRFLRPRVCSMLKVRALLPSAHFQTPLVLLFCTSCLMSNTWRRSVFGGAVYRHLLGTLHKLLRCGFLHQPLLRLLAKHLYTAPATYNMRLCRLLLRFASVTCFSLFHLSCLLCTCRSEAPLGMAFRWLERLINFVFTSTLRGLPSCMMRCTVLHPCLPQCALVCCFQ